MVRQERLRAALSTSSRGCRLDRMKWFEALVLQQQHSVHRLPQTCESGGEVKRSVCIRVAVIDMDISKKSTIMVTQLLTIYK